MPVFDLIVVTLVLTAAGIAVGGSLALLAAAFINTGILLIGRGIADLLTGRLLLGLGFVGYGAVSLLVAEVPGYLFYGVFCGMRMLYRYDLQFVTSRPVPVKKSEWADKIRRWLRTGTMVLLIAAAICILISSFGGYMDEIGEFLSSIRYLDFVNDMVAKGGQG